jgi:hypothetical protein
VGSEQAGRRLDARGRGALPRLASQSRRWYDVLLRGLGGLTAPAGLNGTLSNKQGTGPTHFGYGGGAAEMAGELVRDMRSQWLAPLALAASELADDLSNQDRRRLRESGELPEWFLPKVQERAVEVRKDLRRRRY